MKSKAALKREIYIGIVAILIFVVYFALTFTIIQTGSLVGMSINSIAPDLLPKIIGVLGIIVGFSILIPAITKYIQIKEDKDPLEPQGDTDNQEEKNVPFLTKDRVIILVSMILYLVALEVIGYIIASFLISFGLLTYFEKKNVIKNLIFSILFVGICFYVFNNVLQIWLPLGIFFQ